MNAGSGLGSPTPDARRAGGHRNPCGVSWAWVEAAPSRPAAAAPDRTRGRKGGDICGNGPVLVVYLAHPDGGVIGTASIAAMAFWYVASLMTPLPWYFWRRSFWRAIISRGSRENKGVII